MSDDRPPPNRPVVTATVSQRLVMFGQRARRGPLAKWVAITLVSAGTLCMFVLFFGGFPVCDDQVVNGGQVIEVCRHIQLTDPPVAALGLVMLALVGVFFPEISGFGVSLKRAVTQAEV